MPTSSTYAFAFVALSIAACSSSSSNEDTSSSGAQINACVPETVHGVDVSDYQGNVDWQAVHDSGRGFAIAQVGDGHFEDATFDRNYEEIRRVGMVRGAYQFFRPLNDADAVAQADILLRHLGTLQPGDLPPTLDIEVTSYEGYPAEPAEVIISGVRAWMNRVQQATGVTPIIYTGAWFWPQLANTPEFANHPLWVAAYVSCSQVPIPNGWGDWQFWQYAGSGVSVPGIAGNIDVDVFHGTLDQLRSFGGGCSADETAGAAHFGCQCVDHHASGGFCAGTGCSSDETAGAAHFGCACVDHHASGGFCTGTGCTLKETNDAAKFGCSCVDHEANGGYCAGTGCTELETNDAAKFGCSCVDHKANGGFCAGTGCTEHETADAAKFGCGCVDHKGAGGACAGNGCTTKETNDCSAAHHTCSLHKCVP